jgi:pilus assembly protein CpaF
VFRFKWTGHGREGRGVHQRAVERADRVAPLVEIEASVQARAKDLEVDPRSAGGAGLLRGLIADEVGRWRSDYRRGLRPFDLTNPDQVADRAYRNVAGYGPLEPLLADPDVWEIMVNSPDATFGEP